MPIYYMQLHLSLVEFVIYQSAIKNESDFLLVKNILHH